MQQIDDLKRKSFVDGFSISGQLREIDNRIIQLFPNRVRCLCNDGIRFAGPGD